MVASEMSGFLKNVIFSDKMLFFRKEGDFLSIFQQYLSFSKIDQT